MSSRESSSAKRPDELFHLEGEYWTIAYAGQLIRLKDTTGLHYLAHLLRHPGQAFPVVELRAVAPRASLGQPLRSNPPGATDAHAAERARKAVTNRIRQSVARIAAAHATLGLHLTNAVHTGARCAYTPERPVQWST